MNDYNKLIDTVKIMLSPSEKILFNLVYFLGIYLSLEFAQGILARLMYLAWLRSNTVIRADEITNIGDHLQKEMQEKFNKKYN
jgi:hypothetical protein